MQYWEEAIYKTIEMLGGEADLQDIYAKLPDLMELTDRHLEITKWGGRPAYHHIVRSYISNMIESGLVRRLARGRYKIIKYLANP